MAVSADALIRQLTETYAIQCRRARAEIEWSKTAQEVVAMLARPVKPSILRGEPVEHQERLMWAAAGERISVLHRSALAFLGAVPEGEFHALLDWHCRVNLAPCKPHFPAAHQDFEARLRHMASNRRLAEMKGAAPHVLH